VRAFYVAWFIVCAALGFALAGFEEAHAPSWAFVAVCFPGAVLLWVAMLTYGLYRMPPGQLAQPPSLRLRPWDVPVGFQLFVCLTFVFGALWGVAFCVLAGLPGLRVAVHSLALGLGGLVALFVCRRALPAKFST
jgi:hypothetical protein